MGKLQFAYRGVPYYLSDRDQRRIPGVQSRYFSNRTIFNVTTFEQTLLDTLHRPLHCGGQAVVFEAWETALSALNEARLLDYLRTIDDPKLDRRVGYLLTVAMKYKPGTALAEHLAHAAGSQRAGREPSDYIPLLTGVRYQRTDDRWRLEVP